MTKRICDGLLYMNKEKGVAHRDIKLRLGSYKRFLLIDILNQKPRINANFLK